MHMYVKKHNKITSHDLIKFIRNKNEINNSKI